MPKKSSKRPRTTKTARKKSPRATTRSAPSADEKVLTDSLLAHGQAAKLGRDGKLPPGATHELIEDENGKVRAVRRRFSAF